MSAVGTAIRLAERNGISVPEFIKFLASPAGYAIAKALDAIETQAKLPQGILSLAQNPAGAATNYLQTQAENALFNENNASKIESIISELQGTNPDKPNYVGPQQPDSTLSQLNTAMLPFDLGVQPSYETPIASSNNMNDELREGMFGTITPNFPSFVGPQELNSPADQIDTQFLIEDLGVKPTSNTATTSNTDSSTNISNVFGNTSPASLGLIETQSMPDYSRAYSALGGAESVANLRNEFLDMGLDENAIGSLFSNYYAPEIGDINFSSNDFGGMDFGGGGGGGGGLGKYDYDFSSMAYARGGQIYRGRR